MNDSTQVMVFGSKDDFDAGWVRAKVLVAELQKRQVPVKLINKAGFDLDDLHLVARYRVVSTPTVLLVRNGRTVYRKLGLPAACALLDVIHAQTAPVEAPSAPSAPSAPVSM